MVSDRTLPSLGPWFIFCEMSGCIAWTADSIGFFFIWLEIIIEYLLCPLHGLGALEIVRKLNKENKDPTVKGAGSLTTPWDYITELRLKSFVDTWVREVQGVHGCWWWCLFLLPSVIAAKINQKLCKRWDTELKKSRRLDRGKARVQRLRNIKELKCCKQGNQDACL